MLSMQSTKVLLSVLVLATCPAFEARILRAHVASHDEQPAAELKRAEPKEEKPEKKMTDPISFMRGELCWSREKLIGHAPCMKWLVKECTTTSFGTGLCNRVGKHVKKECEEEKNKEACDYAKQLGIDIVIDSDKDGVPDEKDAFPDDPKESKDTDGDGVGDKGDDYPNDPKCQKKPCPVPPPAASPAPAPKAEAAPSPAPAEKKEDTPAPAPAVEEKEAPAPAPAVAEEKKEAPAPAPAVAEKTPAPKPAAEEAPAAYKDPNAKDGLQSQGFTGKKVVHVDGETVVSDWGKEYGNHKGSHPKKSGSTRAWQPHALALAVGALTLACAV